MRVSKALANLVFFFLISYTTYSISKILLEFSLLDFGVYYEASQHFIHNINPYIKLSNNMYFIYPPTALYFLTPTTILQLQTSENIWTILSIASLFLSLTILLKLLNPSSNLKQIIFIYTLTFLFFPVKFTFGLGQINIFILLLIILSFLSHTLNKNFLAGLLLGLAISIKITPLVLILYYIKKKKTSTILGIITFLAISLTCLHLSDNLSLLFNYFQNTFTNLPIQDNSSYYNQSFQALTSRLNMNPNLSSILNLFLLCFSLLLTYKKIDPTSHNIHNNLSTQSLLLLNMLLFGGLAWQHHFVITLIPIILIFSQSPLISILSFLLIGLNLKEPHLFNPLLNSHVFWGTLLLYITTLKSISHKNKNN